MTIFNSVTLQSIPALQSGFNMTKADFDAFLNATSLSSQQKAEAAEIYAVHGSDPGDKGFIGS